jgi:predicted alpha/beta superfamily hydrolase
MRAILISVVAALAAGFPAAARQTPAPAQPLAIGETFTMPSKALGEERRINVYVPKAYGLAPGTPLPVMYMPDGGIEEDFQHVAGLIQVSVGNGTMRPFMLVGIENTQRRRDMTGPTSNDEDRKIAPVVGGSAAFRAFIKNELMPAIRGRYPTTPETAIVGESLAGLFVVETLFVDPAMFDTYIAFDPSLWWNNEALLRSADAALPKPTKATTVFLANSSEKDLARETAAMAERLQAFAAPRLTVIYRAMPDETHATIYHPAALRAFRALFAPPKPQADAAGRR